MITLRNFTRLDIPVLQSNGYNKYSYNELCNLIDRWQNDKSYNDFYFEMFAIVNDNEVVGSASLYQRSQSIISCGPNYQRKGYATTAYGQMLTIAKNKGYKIAVAQIRVDNIASIGLNKKLGFEAENHEYVNQKGNKVYYFIKNL